MSAWGSSWGSAWGSAWGPVEGQPDGAMYGVGGFTLTAVAQAVGALYADGVAALPPIVAIGELTAADTGPVDISGAAAFSVQAFGIMLDGNESPILRRIFAAPTGGGPSAQVTLEQVLTAKRKKREREEILLLL